MIFQHGFNHIRDDRPNENGSIRRSDSYVLTVRTECCSRPIEADFKPIGAKSQSNANPEAVL